MDDRELIAAIAAGNSNALREMYDRHAGWLATRLRTMLPAHAVEDVLQETFLAVWRGAGRYQGTGAVGGWRWGIARRQAAIWLRKHQKTDLLLDPDQELTHMHDTANSAVIRADIERALTELATGEPHTRKLAQLAFVEEQPVKEIARQLRI